MNASEHDQFWLLYEKNARRPIERACRRASRTLTDNAMDADDMIAWVDRRIWRLLERGGWPTFHDDPTPERAVDRIVSNASTLARWAYLALSRRHWSRTHRQQAYMAGLSRTERLAMVSAGPAARLERDEQVARDLARLRSALSAKVRRRLAASWHEQSERHRVALALNATGPEDDELIERVNTNQIRPNTIQQMRSRSRRQALDALRPARRLALLAIVMSLALSGSRAIAGEQTGGRGGNGLTAARAACSPVPAALLLSDGGEQSGGRGGHGLTAARATGSPVPAALLLSEGGEQSGGRGG